MKRLKSLALAAVLLAAGVAGACCGHEPIINFPICIDVLFKAPRSACCSLFSRRTRVIFSAGHCGAICVKV